MNEIGDPQNKKKVSKRGLLFLMTLTGVISLYLWFDYFVVIFPNDVSRLSQTMFPAITMSALSVILFMEVLRFGKDRKIYHYIAYIFAIPLIPLFIVGLLSQTRLMASLTLPMFVLLLFSCVSSYAFQLLELLGLGDAFNNNVIPYLNLTTITLVFVYAGNHIIRYFARVIPNSYLPKAVKDVTFELLDRRLFIRIAYILLTLLFVISTIETLGGTDYFYLIGKYKNIALQSLITFAAIDRLVSKWNSK